MRKLGKYIFSIFIFYFPLFALADDAPDPYQLNMSPGVTPISHDIYDLHMIVFWVCVAIGIAVFGVMIYSMIMHRKSKNHQPAQFHSSAMIELLWTVIPFLFLIIMAVPATIVLMRMDDAAKPDLNIEVTGYQWKWRYEYLDYGISFFSNLSTPLEQTQNKQPKGQWYLLEVDHPLVLPIHKKVRFLVTSNDVIHSWWVPALGIKRDAIPGFIHEAWARIETPGTYRGQCAELCGMNHAFMPIVVIAKTEAEFDQWVAEQKRSPVTTSTAPAKAMTKDALMSEGEKVYNASCAACHKPDGSGTPPAFPAIKGGKISTGPVAAHLNIVINGKSGTAMQAFKDQLNDEQIAAVITYERNSWGNDNQQTYGKNAGGLVQPADITAAKKGS
jgi:cytochrome c oxidase subunit 2